MTQECFSQELGNHLFEMQKSKEDSSTISQSPWEVRSITSVGFLLQTVKLPPVMEIGEFAFPLGKPN